MVYKIYKIYVVYLLVGASGGVVVKALRYKTGRSRFRFIILPVALWPCGRINL